MALVDAAAGATVEPPTQVGVGPVMALTPLRDAVIVAGVDGAIATWDAEANVVRRLDQRIHDGPIRAVHVMTDAQLVVTAGQDGTLRLLDVHTLARYVTR